MPIKDEKAMVGCCSYLWGWWWERGLAGISKFTNGFASLRALMLCNSFQLNLAWLFGWPSTPWLSKFVPSGGCLFLTLPQNVEDFVGECSRVVWLSKKIEKTKILTLTKTLGSIFWCAKRSLWGMEALFGVESPLWWEDCSVGPFNKLVIKQMTAPCQRDTGI